MTNAKQTQWDFVGGELFCNALSDCFYYRFFCLYIIICDFVFMSLCICEYMYLCVCISLVLFIVLALFFSYLFCSILFQLCLFCLSIILFVDTLFVF